MSLLTTGFKIASGLGLFGGNGNQGPNIANKLSAEVGCTILQKDASAARAALASGINPCTGFTEMLNRPLPSIANFGPGFGPAFPSTAMSALPTVGRTVARGVGGLIRTSTGRVSRIVLPSGQVFSRKNAAALIRRVGFEAAAVALGITVLEAAELLLTDSKARRRRRGITGAQLANAKRVNCAVKRMAADLGVKGAPVRRRRTTCR